MKKVRVALPDYLSEEHVNATKKLISIMSGIKVDSETNTEIMITVENDDVMKVLEDMNVCDYMMISVIE